MAARNRTLCCEHQCLGSMWALFLISSIISLSGTGATAATFLPKPISCFSSPPLRSTSKKTSHARSNFINNGCRSRTITLHEAPEGALKDIVVPSIFNLSDWQNAIPDGEEKEEDPRIWVPQTDCLSFRPLCFCTSQGYYVNLLKFTGGGVLGRHRHSSPVHALTLKGSWGYREHDWHAYPGSYVFEPPGETHTLMVDDDCEEMVAFFHVTGSLLYVSEETGDVIGFDDVFSKLEKARSWYEECGLGKEYANQFIR